METAKETSVALPDEIWSNATQAEHSSASSLVKTPAASDAADKTSLMTLPPELRLQIFDCIEDSDHARSVSIAQNCIHRLEANGCPTLAALSRTCKRIHGEVGERLYRYRKFYVDIVGSDSMMALWRRNFDKDLQFLNRIQKVHLAITINTGTTKLQPVLEMMGKVLALFTKSTELLEFTFEVREMYHWVTRHNYVHFKLECLRIAAASEALEAGKSEKEKELDVAWAVFEFFKNEFR